MIACIELSEKCVWGFGPTEAVALANARREIAEKPHFKVGELQFAPLAQDADLAVDGLLMWEWVMLPGKGGTKRPGAAAPVQSMLF